MNELYAIPHATRYTLGVSAIATLAGFLFGYDTGVVGSSQPYFSEYFQFTQAQQVWAVSSGLYGCLLGALSAGYLNTLFSRKYALIFSAFLMTVSAIGSGIPESLTALVFFRIVGGLGVGIAAMTSPTYISEIAPANARVKLVSFYQLAIVVGFSVVFIATYFIGGGNTSYYSLTQLKELHEYNVLEGWRIMFWSELIPAFAFLVLLFFVPHSPRWLMLKGREEEALKVLVKLSPSEKIALEKFDELKAALRQMEPTKPPVSFGKNVWEQSENSTT